MWTYSTNFMGPFDWWYNDNKIPFTIEQSFSKILNKDISFKRYHKSYAGGRIDCYCSNSLDKDFDPYNRELFLPIMEQESFDLFSNWLLNIQTESLFTEKQLFTLFKEETNFDLIFFYEKDNPIMEK